MTKQNSNLTEHPAERRIARTLGGFTLIELLVVISILVVISAIMIPKLRMVNKDRNIREAARIVASAFAKASARAVNDGSAGLIIVPNSNFQGATFSNVGGTDVDMPFYAGTRIYQMRKLPAYVGDDEDAVATLVGGMVQIDRPFEHDEAAIPPRLIIEANDEISFNGSSYRYRIVGVTLAGLNLNLTLDTGSAPAPQLGTAGVPYVIHRQPRQLESSLVELPDGYLIDLRYSGPVLTGAASQFGTLLNQNQTSAVPAPVVLHFDANGGISRMLISDKNYLPTIGTEAIKLFQPTESLYWLVTNYDPNAIDFTTGAPASQGQDPIQSPSNKWVTVDQTTGSVNVASAAVPSGSVDVDGDGSVNLADRILESREIADDRQSTSQ